LQSHQQLQLPHKPPPTSPKQAVATGHRCQAQATCKEQRRLPVTTTCLASGACQPQQTPANEEGGGSPHVIVAEPHPRCSSFDFSQQDPPQSVNQRSLNTPAARSSRTAASVATPADRATQSGT
ncbi:hypothetical protein SORBI_3003G181900, partial [Sorghum bicolor]